MIEVIEVIEYVDDWEGDDGDFDLEVVEVVEKLVTVPSKKFSPLFAYQVGIGEAPPPFLMPQELVQHLKAGEANGAQTNGHHQATLPDFIQASTYQGSKPGYVFRASPEKGLGYHLDDYQLQLNPHLRQQLLQQTPPATTTTTTTTTSSSVTIPAFFPCATYQGSKPGYVFRSSPENGTGYHLDDYQLRQNPALRQQLEQEVQQQQQQQPLRTTPAAAGRALQPQTTKRISTKRHQSIIAQAIVGIESDDDEILEEEIIEEEEEEIIEEEYMEDEIIEEEYYDEEEYEEYYDEDEEYIIEEVIEEETEEEAKAREQLEQEIADIERQIAAAKAAKEQRVAAGECDGQETSKEKAERMAAKSRLEACKKEKEKSDFKRKAAARAKVLAEREKNWGKKGKKKQKDLSEIIASKAKKQKKLVARQKAKDAALAKKKAAASQNGTAAAAPAKPAAATPKAAAPAAAAAPEADKPQEEGKQLSMAEMLAQKMQKGAKGMEMGKAKASTDIKSAAADDFGDDDLKLEDFLPSDDEEEEEEKEPELTPEEEHAKRLQWEKPSWTQAKLRNTAKGNKIKAGKYISAPITMIPKKINEGLEEEDEDDKTPSQAALMKGAIAMVQLPKVKKHHAGLKFTGNGARIRDGRQIEKQINPKVKNKEEVKIWGADPEDLKLTPRGLTARKGKILSEEITNATQTKKHGFEKPAWAKTKPSHLLKTTETGQHLKEGEDIAPVITDTAELRKKHAFEKPAWLQKQLKTTDEGKLVKEGASLSAPIVDLTKKTMNVNMEANPAFLRMTDQGEKLMEEGNLEGPITAAPALAKGH